MAFNTVLLLIGVLLGSAFAHRAGLVSLIVHRAADTRHRLHTLPVFAVAGVGIGIALAVFDAWLVSAIPDINRFIESHSVQLSSLQWGWASRVFYGAFTMEVMWRWGLMSLTTFVCLRVLPRRHAIVAAILVSSLLFALDHLPLLYQSANDVPTAMVARILVLNVLTGVAFGVTYARHSLEAAMLMHGTMNFIGVGIGVA